MQTTLLKSTVLRRRKSQSCQILTRIIKSFFLENFNSGLECDRFGVFDKLIFICFGMGHVGETRMGKDFYLFSQLEILPFKDLLLCEIILKREKSCHFFLI